jgi:hypothetical protein
VDAVINRAAAAAAATSACSTKLIDIGLIAEAQHGCPDCQRVPDSAALRVLKVQIGGQAVLVDPSSSVRRQLVSAQLQ